MINIYTDGSYDPSTGIGGWAALIEEPNKESLCVSGQESAEQKNTNQRMEQLAIIKALEATKATAVASRYCGSGCQVVTTGAAAAHLHGHREVQVYVRLHRRR